MLTEHGRIRTSTVVCAAGAWSSRLLRPLGIRLPSLWIKGSVARTAPVKPLTTAGVWGRASFRQRGDGRLYLALGIEGDHPVMIDSLRFLPDFVPVYLQNRSEMRHSSQAAALVIAKAAPPATPLWNYLKLQTEKNAPVAYNLFSVAH